MIDQVFANIIGGLSYFEVTSADQDFFWSDNRKKSNGIQIQFQLRGMSVSVPLNTYSTTIYYTLIDS